MVMRSRLSWGVRPLQGLSMRHCQLMLLIAGTVACQTPEPTDRDSVASSVHRRRAAPCSDTRLQAANPDPAEPPVATGYLIQLGGTPGYYVEPSLDGRTTRARPI